MKSARHRVLMSLYPNCHGFAYVVFDGSALFDWGMSDVRGRLKNKNCLRRIAKLLDRYEPDILVLRDATRLITPRDRRVAVLIEAIEELASRTPAITAQVSREQVRDAFAHLVPPTRLAVVEAIARHIPQLESFVPPIRKIWESEDRRMGLFDAAALALTFFHLQVVPSSKAA